MSVLPAIVFTLYELITAKFLGGALFDALLRGKSPHAGA